MRFPCAMLTLFLGAFFTFIGSVKTGAGHVAPPVYAMQFEAISTRYQPALARLLPSAVAPALRDLPTEAFMRAIGLTELVYGLCMLASLTPLRSRLGGLPAAFTRFMLAFMVGPVVAHLLGDDFGLPLDSPVGPTGFVPAAIVLMLVYVKSSGDATPGRKAKAA